VGALSSSTAGSATPEVCVVACGCPNRPEANGVGGPENMLIFG
jgi:hypothetical protein